MKKFRRIAAIVAIILLGGMYLACFICALIQTEHAQLLFRMALGATIAVPVVFYGLLVLMKVFPFASKLEEEKRPTEEPSGEGDLSKENPSEEAAPEASLSDADPSEEYVPEDAPRDAL